MKSQRLMILLATMGVLIVMRLWAPASAPTTQVVEPARRSPTPHVAVAQPELPRASASSAFAPASAPSAEAADPDDAHGNPFAARHPSPLPSPSAAPVAVAAAEPPAPDPLQSYQVIGTFDDVSAPGVFVVTPNGVEIARVGGHLGSDFKVEAITRKNLTLKQNSSAREFTLSIPAGGSP